jgi:signal transduction histidine kinase
MILMYNNNVKLSDNLLELNVSLEKKVEDRTFELNNSLKELKGLTQFKEDLTHMIVHDLKTPLSAIINVELFSDDKNRVGIIKQSGFTMLNLVQNILDVYKYKNSEFDLNKNKIPLIEIVDKAFQEIEFLAEQKLISFERSKSIRCSVNVDEEIIRRVFSNILSNAVKFSPRNGKIRLFTTIDKNNTLRVIVTNQGPSIPKEKQKTIFEKFGQVEKKDHGNIASTGLGLTFCKMAIEAHRGKIGVISEEDKGVEFWFTLPDSICVGCENCKIDFINRKGLELVDSDKEYLKAFIESLLEHRVFEITAINTIIKEINVQSEAMGDWVNELEKVIYSGDDSAYLKLLEL